MQSDNLLNINLTEASATSECLHIELTDRFFADLEQEEISGGEIHAHIQVRASAGDIFTVNIEVSGHVFVPCDRCLDPLRMEIEAHDTVKVKDADPEECDDPELMYLEKGNRCCDLSWCVYEIIETSLPMQRVHEEGECNPDMVSYILSDDYSTEED